MKSKYFSNEFMNKMRDFLLSDLHHRKPLSALVSTAVRRGPPVFER
jgi:hypothetical protein